MVDLWASSCSQTYTGDTLQTIWSSTKNLTSLAVAMLVDLNLLTYSDPIAKHWPEFGQHGGKKDITVADVLRHEGGMPTFSQQMEIEDSWPENIFKNGIGKIIEREESIWPDHQDTR